ncbi:MAG: response regulator [Bryobacterales bacterium]|nr:response regulator [Bryobacterales bacterium]
MDPPMKVIIVDDERRARERLARLLSPFPDLNVVAEAENGLDAISCIDALKPDAVFLDIQMPGIDGFEVLENLTFRPQIIFATAYDQYAIRAFEANAVDYLLKPIEADRLSLAVARLRERQSSLDAFLRSRPPLKRLVGKRLQRLHVLPVEQIEYFLADGELVFAVTAAGRHMLNTTLRDLESRLAPDQFIRIHKSAIVNLSHVAELDPDSRSSGSVRLLSGESIELSRRYAARLRNLLGW